MLYVCRNYRKANLALVIFNWVAQSEEKEFQIQGALRLVFMQNDTNQRTPQRFTAVSFCG